ncbi:MULTISPECIES: low molecular weight protein-tyrosine-phosphatase [unclassified Sphingomonas]|uniref:low molecular weight protein-tyrosine-phosphatase n=1 Tax=unclassified Sphingomonas TaxID=196159 RepID=UPI0006FE6C5C|nr:MULTISPECIES: low molecular weight protein-tyrosine-phosphatase [unclassified Sphingomonas]KQM61974.1 phosphotyrosine protein phosphatase [Sphingomonas sp. Leaf16]KQN13266.1 phosphotyrosine protein phosphatase [Sphingomonas sp. Leaf29]KQN20150.1 phosphotyrosine protein phosphatase [Sphingomonas sp. Leaf32]
MPTRSILFVCLGNICRSPLAEAALRDAAARAGVDLEVDSAGTGAWHVGDPPDRRAQAEARRHGIDISGYRGRQVQAADFQRFTHIYALDHDNLAELRRRMPVDATAVVALLMDVVPARAGQAVADPYYGDAAGFAVTWGDVSAAAAAIVAGLR